MTDSLLKTIDTPAKLRTLSMDQLYQLADEIRQLIKLSVSQSGGHLASNLGVVELSIALHYVFNFSHDRLVFDVGHQCYVHKILTGRADRFNKLRQAGGISGFPSPAESEYDQFYVGHAGTGVATAVGLALGEQMQQSDRKVVSIVGDASIVNGLSFEGLNNINLIKRQMLIILNDNFMAIDKTQGAFAQYLTKLRVSRSYEDLHRRTKLMVKRLPMFGEAIHDTIARLRDSFETLLLGRHQFEQLGMPFYGPIDGHDLENMIKIFSALHEIEHPVLLHVHTDKGRGFEPAIEDPTTFHSPSPFKLNGESASFEEHPGHSFTESFADHLSHLMAQDEKIIAITAAMPDGTGLARVKERFPNRVIDVGIAESGAVNIAAGLAKTGWKPVVAIYSTFMQRGFDQVFQEVSLQDLPVVFCMDRAGLVGGDGAVHHGFSDIAFMRVLPRLELIAPIDDLDMKEALCYALNGNKPCAIRYPRDVVKPDSHQDSRTPYVSGRSVWLQPGRDAVIVAYGTLAYEAIEAACELQRDDLQIGVVNARFAKPLDEALWRDLLVDNPVPVFTLEDHALIGGFGAAVLEFARDRGWPTEQITRLGIPDRYIAQNSRKGQLAEAGLDADSIAACVRSHLHRAQTVRLE